MEDIDAEDCVSAVSSDDERLFELTCLELANKSSRRILKEVASGRGTASEIAKKTGLSVQDVLIHLGRLESIELIEKDHSVDGSLRGRNPRHFKISRLAVVLIPTEITGNTDTKRFISRKSFELLKKRILVAGSFALAWSLSFVLAFLYYRELSIPMGITQNNGFKEIGLLVFLLELAISSLAIFGLTFKLIPKFWKNVYRS